MPGKEIALVLFDLDGVLAELDRARRLAILAELTGKDPAFLHAAIWTSDFERSAEAGAYPTGAEYLAEFNRRAQAALGRESWIRARRESMKVRLDVLEIAGALSARCAIAMLTNNGALLLEALPEIAPEVHQLFGERAHASFEFRARKPEPEVFERLLDRYAVLPERTVFIDDDAEYVAGARRTGMHALRYTGPADLTRRLLALGLAPGPVALDR
jgi:HAD superfamily hydrolase (TIGR01509 family)